VLQRVEVAQIRPRATGAIVVEDLPRAVEQPLGEDRLVLPIDDAPCITFGTSCATINGGVDCASDDCLSAADASEFMKGIALWTQRLESKA